MSKRLTSFAVLILVLGLAGQAGANTYTDAGPTHLWNDPCNWTEGLPNIDPLANEVPSGQWANMIVDGTVCIIDSTINASAGGVYPGCYGATNEMFMTGGTLTCKYLNIGRGNSHSGGNGYFKMTGGQIDSQQEFKIPNQFEGSPGNITGHVDLHGGTVSVGGSFIMGSRTSGMYEGGVGTMDVAGGTLIAVDDQTATIQRYIDNGWITAYGGGGDFVLDYDNRNAGKTTLTAVQVTARAYNPNPKSGAAEVVLTPVLSWTAGASAARHDVYFGKDFGQVSTDTTALGAGQDANSYPDAGTLDLDIGTTYYWRVDQIEAGGTIHKGNVWSFTTANYLVVDGFESYDAANPLSSGWTDAGSAKSTIEATVTHGGNQAMKVEYNDTVSELVGAIADADWTAKNVRALYISCKVDPNVSSLSVRLNDAGTEQVSSELGPSADWQELHFDLGEFGVDLSSVNSIAIKITPAAGAAGVVYIDDIRLYPCIPGLLEFDFNGDCVVDFKDFATMADSWYESGFWP